MRDKAGKKTIQRSDKAEKKTIQSSDKARKRPSKGVKND